ncbi:hypothetical protein ACJJTC_001058 [Scirpophaga incertulas]
MRRGRETLLTLLEAFVYDPLVEWGGGAAAGRRRRSPRDLRSALSMLAVRAAELRHDLTSATDQLVAVLPELQTAANEWLQEDEELSSVQDKLEECQQQMTLIKEIESYGSKINEHPLYAISQKYSLYKQAKNAVEDSMKVLVKILKDFDAQIEAYTETTEALNGPQLMNWVQEYSGTNEDEEKPIFEPIKEFLTNAGQSSMISQCELAENELNQCMQQTNALIRSCLELLTQYVAVSQYYPQSQTEFHRIVICRKYLAAALENRSPEYSRELANQVNTLMFDEDENKDVHQIVAYNFRLQTILADANSELNKAIDALQQEGGADALKLAQEAYTEAKNNISNWVRTEEGAASALECAVVGMLCNLNRRYLMLENGAQSAGDCLVDLTSREGEWFLDDMSALSMQAVELLSLIPLQSASVEENALPVVVECVRHSNLLLADLVQLNHNFSTIILPEALKKVHSEDPSVLQMISDLNDVIVNSPVPLNELLAQLELHLRYLIMDMESPASGAQANAQVVRARYEALLCSGAEAPGAGRMLLMGFNGLFAAVELRARELAELALPVPPAWRKIDHVSDALHMSAAMQRPALRGVLEHILAVRRVQAVGEALAQCCAAARGFGGDGAASAAPDHAALQRPVRRWTAEYVSRCVLGVGSLALGAALCLLLRRAGLCLLTEVEQKEIGASWSVSLESLCEKATAGRADGPLLERARVLAGAACSARAALARAAAAVARRARAAAAHHCARLRALAHDHLHAQIKLYARAAKKQVKTPSKRNQQHRKSIANKNEKNNLNKLSPNPGWSPGGVRPTPSNKCIKYNWCKKGL